MVVVEESIEAQFPETVGSLVVDTVAEAQTVDSLADHNLSAHNSVERKFAEVVVLDSLDNLA